MIAEQYELTPCDPSKPGVAAISCQHGRSSGQVCWPCRVVVPWLNGRLGPCKRALDAVLRSFGAGQPMWCTRCACVWREAADRCPRCGG